MFEKVNPAHPDKLADRIAGAIVDIAYETQIDPKVAVEVLIGHGVCHAIVETSAEINRDKVVAAVHRIAGKMEVDLVVVPQDAHLAQNQSGAVRCGDNGIFKGMPVTEEQKKLAGIARAIYAFNRTDGKYILNGDRLIICQSNADSNDLRSIFPNAEVNPLGDWTGGTDVDTGATNRKLGSDMADNAPASLWNCAAPSVMSWWVVFPTRISWKQRESSFAPWAVLRNSLSGVLYDH